MISSKQPRKQRKFRNNAPLHIKQKFVGANLSKDLRKKYGIRSIGLRKGDQVKVMRGDFKKKNGSVDIIKLNKGKVIISGIDLTKKDGSKVPVFIQPSNLMITELNLDDKRRKEILERNNNAKKTSEKA